MKQNITTKQLNELSEKGSKEWRGFITGDRNHHKGDEKRVSEMSTIGQMIEFLMNKGSAWIDVCNQKYNNFDRDDELADLLWEAVKEVLK